MNTILHIAHNAASANHKSGIASEPSNVRLLLNVDDSELHLLDDVTQKLHVVHFNQFAEEIISSQKKVSDAVRMYEDRIYKRVPLDIA